MNFRNRAATLVPLLLCVLPPTLAPAQGGAPEPVAVITVGDTVIHAAEYETALRNAMRDKFYHGKPTAAQIAAFRREVAERLIERALLRREAERRHYAPRADRIEETLKRRTAGHKTLSEDDRARLRRPIEEDDLVRQVEESVKKAGPVDEARARAYYEAHPAKFTEPEQSRVFVILLKVDPSAPKVAWDAARAEGETIAGKLKAGAAFGELARLHSGGPGAEAGGDLGYVHRGMLAENVQAALDRLAPGAHTEPLMVLDGVALFRIEDRRPARLNPFDAVRDRALKLAQEDQAERAWKEFLATLRAGTPVRVNDAYLERADGKG